MEKKKLTWRNLWSFIFKATYDVLVKAHRVLPVDQPSFGVSRTGFNPSIQPSNSSNRSRLFYLHNCFFSAKPEYVVKIQKSFHKQEISTLTYEFIFLLLHCKNTLKSKYILGSSRLPLAGCWNGPLWLLQLNHNGGAVELLEDIHRETSCFKCCFYGNIRNDHCI